MVLCLMLAGPFFFAAEVAAQQSLPDAPWASRAEESKARWGDAQSSGTVELESVLSWGRLLDAVQAVAVEVDESRRGADGGQRTLDRTEAGTDPDTPPRGWIPFQGTFGRDEAAHLLRRTLIGPRLEEIELAAERGLSATVQDMMVPRRVSPPGEWVHEPVVPFHELSDSERLAAIRLYLERQTQLRLWWVDQIVESEPDLLEMMTLFWHDHFATGMESVFIPQSMYRQHELIRKHAFGNFRSLLHEMAIDPAMLMWLDGRRNTVVEPNENFSRELLELFTMGEGAGYTQQDVAEGARACTGWATDGLRAAFFRRSHDDGLKTILGQTGPWDIHDFIDIILEQPQTAEHIAGKLYRWFVHREPAPDDVRELAEVFRSNDYEIAPVLQVILSSDQFYDVDVRGAQVKSGVDIYAGLLRTFHVSGYSSQLSTHALFVIRQMQDFDQLLFDPPTVAGWPGHLDWINTQTLPLRKIYVDALVQGSANGMPLSMGINVMAETRGFQNPNDPYVVVDDLALLSFGQPPTPLVRQRMLETLLQGAEPYDWSIDLPDSRERLVELYRYTVRLPDFQLK